MGVARRPVGVARLPVEVARRFVAPSPNVEKPQGEPRREGSPKAAEGGKEGAGEVRAKLLKTAVVEDGG